MHLSRYLLRPLGAAIGKQLEHYSQFQPSSLSIQQYLDFGRTGNVTSSYVFLKKELLVRLANIMQVGFLSVFFGASTKCLYHMRAAMIK